MTRPWLGLVIGLALASACARALAGCTGPPPSHALVVRHPERKCALIMFPGCAALLPEPHAARRDEPPALDEDAGLHDEDGGADEQDAEEQPPAR